jgi:catechol 2,3-dioxygenase-like lactoylglutathione lyase family enzyme
MATGQLITFLYTDDLDRSTAFYRDVMRLTPVVDQGPTVIFRVAAAAYLGVSTLPHRPRGTEGVMITFVRPVEAEYERLREAGVAFEGPPAWYVDGTVYAVFFRDPDGYRLEVQEFADPRWDAALD